MMAYKVWTCKIVVPEHAEIPDGFDGPPRMAAIRAVEQAGIPVLSCFSGWGGELSQPEESFVRRDEKMKYDCPHCEGTGTAEFDEPCDRCKGTGIYPRRTEEK
jgi:hypothetical protein